jgi:hypothetical protein
VFVFVSVFVSVTKIHALRRLNRRAVTFLQHFPMGRARCDPEAVAFDLTLSFSDKGLADFARRLARFWLFTVPTCRDAIARKPSLTSVLGEQDMMAFVFFLLWMLASIALLTVWVFRQTPPASRDSSAAATATAAAVEG